MLGKIFNAKKEEDKTNSNSEIIDRISKMNLTEMRTYVRNGIKDLEICEFGLKEVTNRLIEYLKSDDMPSKKKKAFDLLILIANSKKITIDTVEYMQSFLANNKEIIDAYDREFKDIYSSRFEDALGVALNNLEEMSNLQKKMKILGE